MSNHSETYPNSLHELDERLSRPDFGVLDILRQNPGDCMVLGAAGKMGFHLTRMLQRAMDSLGQRDLVRAVSRFSKPDSRAAFDAASIPILRADLSDPHALDALPNAQNIFFLAGIKFGTADQPHLLRKMNQEMPSLVANRYTDSKLVAMSTGCVYSFTSVDSGGSKETDEMKPPGAYAQSCIERENAFRDQAKKTGTKVTLVRLNYSVELRYGVLVDIAKCVLMDQPVDISTGYVNVIWQRDAVSHIIQSLSLVDAPASVVNVTGNEILSVRQIAEGFAYRMGKNVRFVGDESPECWLSNNRTARSTFGDPEMPIERVMDWITEWLQSGNPTLGKPTHFQIRDGNY